MFNKKRLNYLEEYIDILEEKISVLAEKLGVEFNTCDRCGDICLKDLKENE